MAPSFEYLAVEFDLGGGKLARVPLAEAQAFHDDQFHPAGAWASRVFWRSVGDTEERWSFAKSWIYRATQRISRIGSGAYGDGEVIQYRPDPRPSATLAEYQRQSAARQDGGAS